jgi:hypothetical protein
VSTDYPGDFHKFGVHQLPDGHSQISRIFADRITPTLEKIAENWKDDELNSLRLCDFA